MGGLQAVSTTWPVLLVVLALWFSPWIFNPHSFQASTIMVYLEEFRSGSTPRGRRAERLAQWHVHFRSLRQRSARKFLLFVGQKFFPKLVSSR